MDLIMVGVGVGVGASGALGKQGFPGWLWCLTGCINVVEGSALYRVGC